jgi:transporter family-2 protein
MPTELIVPLVLGIAAVLQAALNREVASHTGLAAATALNMLVAAIAAFAFAAFCAVRKAPEGLLRWHVASQDFRAWWLLPGLIGFALVLGLPWAIERAGALATFVVLVAAQMLASTLWDRIAGGVPLSWPRVLGALCTVAGVALVAWKPAA